MLWWNMSDKQPSPELDSRLLLNKNQFAKSLLSYVRKKYQIP